MEDDIVQRLRAKELLSVEEDGYTHFLAKNPDGDDGADEIERLRAENEKLRALLTDLADEYEQFAYEGAEIALLKEARAAAAIRESGE